MRTEEAEELETESSFESKVSARWIDDCLPLTACLRNSSGPHLTASMVKLDPRSTSSSATTFAR